MSDATGYIGAGPFGYIGFRHPGVVLAAWKLAATVADVPAGETDWTVLSSYGAATQIDLTSRACPPGSRALASRIATYATDATLAAWQDAATNASWGTVTDHGDYGTVGYFASPPTHTYDTLAVPDRFLQDVGEQKLVLRLSNGGGAFSSIAAGGRVIVELYVLLSAHF